jgi:hypothetical protein
MRRPAPPARPRRPVASHGAWGDPANWYGGFRPDYAEEVVLVAGDAALPGSEVADEPRP